MPTMLPTYYHGYLANASGFLTISVDFFIFFSPIVDRVVSYYNMLYTAHCAEKVCIYKQKVVDVVHPVCYIYLAWSRKGSIFDA